MAKEVLTQDPFTCVLVSSVEKAFVTTPEDPGQPELSKCADQVVISLPLNHLQVYFISPLRSLV